MENPWGWCGVYMEKEQDLIPDTCGIVAHNDDDHN